MTETHEKQTNKSLAKWDLVNLSVELGFIIALPLVAFGLIGKALDHKFGTYPWITLAGIALAVVATTIWIFRRIRAYIK